MTKRHDEFYKNRTRGDGLQGTCKRCCSNVDAQEKHRVRRQNYQKANREAMRAKNRAYTLRIRNEAMAMISPAMICQWPGCDISNPLMLEVDHKDGGGSGERARTGGGGQLFVNIVKGRRSVDDLQILCANHHALKSRTTLA